MARRAAAGNSRQPTAAEALQWLEGRGSKKTLKAMEGFGIPAVRAFGVTVGELRDYGKQIGSNHELSLELWASGWYEARLLAAFVGDASKVTARQMDAWAKEFDNWGVVDTVCFALFDRAPDRWRMPPKWAKARAEFTKRAAFALIWSLTGHDRQAPDSAFRACFPLIEAGATDERHFVLKAVSMALRAIGKRRASLRPEVVDLAEKLAASKLKSARTIGKETLREVKR